MHTMSDGGPDGRTGCDDPNAGVDRPADPGDFHS
jgi:hypothetical protein